MNASQLRAFHAVALAGTFIAAAKRLHVSQPAVTMQVKALEDAYGVELFRRGGRGVELTELGERLKDLTTQMFGTEEAAAELLGAARALRRGRLRVGADAPYHVMALLAAFHQKHPGVTISLTVGNGREVLKALLDSQTEVAVTAEVAPDPRLYAVPCARYRVVAFVGREHAWARRRRLSIADLDGQGMVLREPESITRRTFDRAAEKAGIAPRIVMEIGSREAVREAVAAGMGIGIIASAELGQDKRFVGLPIEDAELENTEYAICLSGRRELRMVRAFFDVLGAMPPVAA